MPRTLRRVGGRLAGVLGVELALLVGAAFDWVRIPRSALRAATAACATGLLGEAADLDGPRGQRGVGLAKAVTARFLEYQLISSLRRDVRADASTSDVQVMEAALRRLKGLLVTLPGTEANVSGWPTLLSGLGYCDQLNGVAATMLAGFFPRAQLVGLWDPVERRSPHSVGRAFSKERSDWLYFDLMHDDVLIFVVGPTGAVRIVSRIEMGASKHLPAPEPAALAKLYGLARTGWVINEYGPSFGHHLLRRVTGGPAGEPAPAASVRDEGATVRDDGTSAGSLESGAGPPAPAACPGFGEAEGDYLNARLEHLLGSPDRAREAYERVRNRRAAEGDRGAAIAAMAAGLFASAPSGPPADGPRR